MRGSLSVTPGFWVALTLLWIVDPQLLLPAALAALLHEGGHALVLRLLGSPVRAVRLTAAGLEMVPAHPLSYRQELAAAAAGPGASLLFALLAARLGRFLPAGVSLALGLFNLLPVPPLDGGRVFRALWALLLPGDASLRVCRYTAAAASGAVLGLALALAFRSGGLSFLLPALWLARQAIFGENTA